MSRKEKLIEFNRKNILDAASKIFYEKGLQQATMDDISKAANYSKSTIYVYFKGKDEIYNHIIYTNMQLLSNMISEAIQSSDKFSIVYFELCKIIVNFSRTHPLFLSSLISEIDVDIDHLDENDILVKIYVVGEEINEKICKWIEKALLKKELRSDIIPIQTTYTLWASICGLILLTNNKEKYFEKSMQIRSDDFLWYGFNTLLQSILFVKQSELPK